MTGILLPAFLMHSVQRIGRKTMITENNVDTEKGQTSQGSQYKLEHERYCTRQRSIILPRRCLVDHRLALAW